MKLTLIRKSSKYIKTLRRFVVCPFAETLGETIFSLVNKTLYALMLSLFLVSCHLKNKTDSNQESVKVLYWGEIPTFNPTRSESVYNNWLQTLVWDKLVNVDKQFIWTSYLAESWEFNSDKTELKLNLSKDLRWSNGRPVELKDFLFSFNYYKDDAFKAAIFKPIFERVREVEYQNFTLRLKLDSKLNKDPFYASHVYWSHIMSTFRLLPYDFKENPYLGSGPYKLNKFSNLKPWNLIKNSESWFYTQYKNLKLPNQIDIKTLKSEEVFKNHLKASEKALVVGHDIYQLDSNLEKKWLSFDSEIMSMNIFFNLKNINFEDRSTILSIFKEINDLQKLNLKYKNFTTAEPKSIQLLFNKRDFVINKKSSFLKPFQLDVFYQESQNEVFLTYLKEKLAKKNIELNFKKVQVQQLREIVLENKYLGFVNDMSEEQFYPHHMLLHSKGEFNLQGWSFNNLDNDLESMIRLSSEAEIKSQILKIYNFIESQNARIPLFYYESSVLWTRNSCKPLQKQFQGLGLIYKAIICANN